MYIVISGCVHAVCAFYNYTQFGFKAGNNMRFSDNNITKNAHVIVSNFRYFIKSTVVQRK